MGKSNSKAQRTSDFCAPLRLRVIAFVLAFLGALGALAV
jgi:hypothetical protein